MTTATLKDRYLELSLKSETAETGLARVMWGVGVTLGFMGLAFAAVLTPLILFDAFVGKDAIPMVRIPLTMLWSGLMFFGVIWLATRPAKWQKEREFEHTAELSDGQTVTLNVRTANGVDSADRHLGEFLSGCQAAALRDWEARANAIRETTNSA